ncbi:MAG: DUF302 domain-containing protein [Nitrososphaerota archaeon]
MIKISEYRKRSRKTFEDTCAGVSEVVKTNSFAVLAEIRTSEILKSKGLDYPDLITYDVCNAGYASKALELDPMVETLVPCHLIVKGSGDQTEVSVQLPGEMFESLHLDKNRETRSFLDEVETKLKRIVDEIAME